MKRLVWIFVIAGVVWVGNEVRIKGLEGAFGGVLAGKLDPLETQGISPDDSNFAE
jgi:hypothetical protein